MTVVKTTKYVHFKRRVRVVFFYGGIKYLFKTDRQIHNRIKSVKRKRKYGSGKLGGLSKKKQSLIGLRGNKCEWCKQGFKKEDLTVDHIVEISNGGSNRLENLRLLCRPCHDLRHEFNVPSVDNQPLPT